MDGTQGLRGWSWIFVRLCFHYLPSSTFSHHGFYAIDLGGYCDCSSIHPCRICPSWMRLPRNSIILDPEREVHNPVISRSKPGPLILFIYLEHSSSIVKVNGPVYTLLPDMPAYFSLVKLSLPAEFASGTTTAEDDSYKHEYVLRAITDWQVRVSAATIRPSRLDG